MSRFPEFFWDCAVLPGQASDPNQLPDVELSGLAVADDWRSEAPRVPVPPDWLFSDALNDAEDHGVFDCEVGDLSGLAPPAATDGPPAQPSGWFSPEERPRADVAALYCPWHFYGDDWGIYFHAPGFAAFAHEIAFMAQQPIAVVEPWVVHQLLAHEFVHFRFEVIGTELEALAGHSLYREYMLHRFALPTRWSGGPLEEAIATAAEVTFAAKRKPRRPRGFVGAVRHLADDAPPGYSEWRGMLDTRRARLVEATLVDVVADRSVVGWAAGGVSAAETREVPVRWIGDPANSPSIAALRSISRPTIRALEKFLRKNNAKIDPRGGKGSHRKFSWRGRKGGYPTSRPILPANAASQIAKDVFGFKRTRQLYEAIADGTVLP